MTYTFDKIQACDIFAKEHLIFHPKARIRASKLYSTYEKFLEATELTDYKVEKHNFWSLLKEVVPQEVLKFLHKRTSKHLYYRGVDLKKNTIPKQKLHKLMDQGIQNISDPSSVQKGYVLEFAENNL